MSMIPMKSLCWCHMSLSTSESPQSWSEASLTYWESSDQKLYDSWSSLKSSSFVICFFFSSRITKSLFLKTLTEFRGRFSKFVMSEVNWSFLRTLNICVRKSWSKALVDLPTMDQDVLAWFAHVDFQLKMIKF